MKNLNVRRRSGPPGPDFHAPECPAGRTGYFISPIAKFLIIMFFIATRWGRKNIDLKNTVLFSRKYRNLLIDPLSSLK
jgi:hypothetical protein